MPSNTEITNNLDAATLQAIEDLAAENFAPSDIALKLHIPKRAFLRVWRDTASPIREAYDRGILEIRSIKERKIIEKIEKDGSITAIQTHDKYAAAREFEDIKRSVFELDD